MCCQTMRKAASTEELPCDRFAWSLARERQWLASERMATVESGGILISNGAERLALRPIAEITFPAQSSHTPRAGTFGGVFSVADAEAGKVYQITASEEAWIDVSTDGHSVARSVAHSGVPDCPGLRKSVRFEMTGPASVQISNASSRTIGLAIAPAN